MNVGAVGAIGRGTAPVYAALSPYLNGVVRTSNAAAAAQLQSTAAADSAAAAQAAVAARSTAAAVVTAAPPFANPAITAIGERIALGQSLVPPPAVTPDALPSTPADDVLHGDSGTLIQSYGAVALATGILTPPPAFAQPVAPRIPPVSQVTPVPSIAKTAA
jgi:hypothetical protein